MNMHFNFYSYVQSDGRKFFETNEKIQKINFRQGTSILRLFGKILVGRPKKNFWILKLGYQHFSVIVGKALGKMQNPCPWI